MGSGQMDICSNVTQFYKTINVCTFIKIRSIDSLLFIEKIELIGEVSASTAHANKLICTKNIQKKIYMHLHKPS